MNVIGDCLDQVLRSETSSHCSPAKAIRLGMGMASQDVGADWHCIMHPPDGESGSLVSP